MARYAADHKETTRRRMIDAAGRRFKSNGIDGAGIATLVADAGLTNGAFYGHFASKDDLVATVVGEQLRDQVARVDALPPGRASVESFVEAYLSPAHRDDLAGGCPSAALLDELARRDPATRDAYTTGSRSMIEAIARHLEPADPDAARPRAISLFALLVGALQLARAVTDTELSDLVLDSARTQAAALVTVSGDVS